MISRRNQRLRWTEWQSVLRSVGDDPSVLQVDRPEIVPQDFAVRIKELAKFRELQKKISPQIHCVIMIGGDH